MDWNGKNDSGIPCTTSSVASSSLSAVKQKLDKNFHPCFCDVHGDVISSESSSFSINKSCDTSDKHHNDDESCTDCGSDNCASAEILGEKIRKQLRTRRKVKCSQNCPVCGLTMRFQEMAEHYEFELRRLQSVKVHKIKKTEKRTSLRQKRVQGVAERRTSRQRFINTSNTSRNSCPTCASRIGTFDTLTAFINHYADCFGFDDLVRSVLLSNQRENMEGYTFEVEERVGSTDPVHSRNDVLNVPSERIQKSDENVVVIVDSDEDNAAYGPSQFTEHDLRPCESSLRDVDRLALRDAVLRSSAKSSTVNNCGDHAGNDVEELDLCEIEDDAVYNRSADADISDDDIGNTSVATKIPRRNSSSESIIVSALKSKIAELENEIQNNSARCNICLGDYREPLVSVTCWHVACKVCWMRVLGEKKLCPRCTRITLPSDLRRIYM